MKQARFRFYAELNDFLPPDKRYADFPHFFAGSPAIKEVIEALGVPHTEVDLVLANGESVDFTYRVEDGDQISVYPVFETFDIRPVLRVRPEPLRVVHFVLDARLGRLAGYLRLLGFDALHRYDCQGEELARMSRGERRTLLTRDCGLLERYGVTHGYCVREITPRRQLAEVVVHFDLFRSIRPFERCVRCNGLLEPVPKERICMECDHVYQEGPHYRRMQRLIEHVFAQDMA